MSCPTVEIPNCVVENQQIHKIKLMLACHRWLWLPVFWYFYFLCEVEAKRQNWIVDLESGKAEAEIKTFWFSLQYCCW